MLSTALAIVLIVILVAGLPGLPLHTPAYGWWPSSLATVMLVVLLVALLMGRV